MTTTKPEEELLLLHLRQHADEHRPERPILLAVDKQLGERSGLRVSVEGADPVGSWEAGETQDAEDLRFPGTGHRTDLSDGLPGQRVAALVCQTTLVRSIRMDEVDGVVGSIDR
jgi:hypothetical protein